MMMFVSTRAHASISVPVYVAPLLPTDGNLRRNAEGLPIETPPYTLPPSLPNFLPPILPPPQLRLRHVPLRSPSRKERFNLTQAGPTTWLRAVEAFPPCYHAETNLTPRLTQEAPAERGRKRRCNIHMKITRLAAM